MLTPPAITYPLDFLPDGPRCSTTGADRPACTVIAALAAHLRGAKLMGAVRNMERGQVINTLHAAMAHYGIDATRAHLWATAINLADCRPVSLAAQAINGLLPSEYQTSAIDRLTHAGGVLNLGVGLGKTLTTAHAAFVYCGRPASPSRCWIVAPLIAHGAWKPYVPYLKTLYHDVQILSIDSVHKFVGAAPIGGLLVVDEAHLAGEMSARRTKALHNLRLGFDVCLCLTGTLLHGGVEKALGVLDLAIPGAAGFSSRWKAGEYFNVLARKFIGQRKVTSLEKPTGEKRQRFNEFISRYVVTLTKDMPCVRAAVEIPDQDLHTIEIGDCSRDLDDLVAEAALALLDRDQEMPNASKVAHYLKRQGTEAKLDWLLDQMDDPDMGVVVFAQYTETLDQIEARIKAEGYTYVRVDGAVTGADRAEAERKFQSAEVQVFLGQMTAAGAAINLYRAFVSVTFDHSDRATDYAQHLGRTCRRGQTHRCYHFDLVANGIQRMCVDRLRAAEDFHLSLAAVQAALQQQGIYAQPPHP